MNMRTKVKRRSGAFDEKTGVHFDGSNEPIQIPKTVRGVNRRTLTSCLPGKIVPHCAYNILREEGIESASIQVDIAMTETVRPLKNMVMVETGAYFVPFTAFDRFYGSHEAYDKSYMGVKDRDADAAPIPLFDGLTFNKTHEFWKTMGIHHANAATIVNAGYLEAYNVICNWLARNRSKNLSARARHTTTLAAAYWQDPAVWMIKPDFDEAMQEGAVALTFTNAQATVKNLGIRGAPAAAATAQAYRGRTAAADWTSSATDTVNTSVAGDLVAVKVTGTGATARPDIYADLATSGIKISLANIELAKQITAWAKKKEAYKDITKEHAVDLLMQGIRVPPEQLMEPMLLDKKTTIFGLNERHAMDGGNLDQSVTTGRTRLSLNFWLPAMNTGGIVMVISQIVPEALWERKQDPFLYVTAGADLPNAMQDFADPQKVDVVPNRYIDVLHDTPDATFGYAPLNYVWKQDLCLLGGKYYRPNPTTFVEDRQEFWTVEQENPGLTTDWYQVPTLVLSPFADQLADPFEIQTMSTAKVVGLTQFGGLFEEDMDNYDEVTADVTQTQIDLP